jgi:hypothetical protein
MFAPRQIMTWEDQGGLFHDLPPKHPLCNTIVCPQPSSTSYLSPLGVIKLTSAALAAALLGPSGLEAPSPPPSVLPGVLDMIFCGTGAVVALFCGADPNTLPGVWKLSGLFSDLEQIFPIVHRSVGRPSSFPGDLYIVIDQMRRVRLITITLNATGDVPVLGKNR